MRQLQPIIVLALALSACGSGATPAPATATLPPPTETIAPTATPRPSLTPTDEPTWTPWPTATRLPTVTPRPPTPTLAPINLAGSGDSVTDSQKPSEAPMLARIEHSGRGNFAVWSYGADGERIDLLVNTIGAYSGTVPIDWNDGEFTKRFEINASGAWTISLLPLNQVRLAFLSTGSVAGSGDDVVAFPDGAIDMIEADFSKAKGNVAIWAYGDTGRDLLVNDIAPYTGVVLAGRGVSILVIKAEGPWALKVTKR